MKLNQWMKAGLGLSFAALWSCPTLAALTAEQNFGLEVKITGQSEDDRDLGTRDGGDVEGVGIDLRPWVYGERGNWSAYAMGQVVSATDTIETDPLDQNDTVDNDTANVSGQRARNVTGDRDVNKSYAAMREFWIAYKGLLTPYPGELLKVGRQRLRNDDGQWHDVNIEAINWTFDTTLLTSEVGVAKRFSEYRTDLTELRADDQDRLHVYGDVKYQWAPSQWAGIRAHHSHDNGDLKDPTQQLDDTDKVQNGDLTWLGLEATSNAYDYRNVNTINYWGSLTFVNGDRDRVSAQTVDGTLQEIKTHRDIEGWATDLGVRFKLDPQWQVGAAYSRASKNYEQNGLESNRSSWTGTRSRIHRFGESFQGEMANVESASLFTSWQLQDEYDASLIYHKFRRVDASAPIGSNGFNAVRDTDSTGNLSETLPLTNDGRKDLGQEVDLVVTKYFKQGLLPAALSQSIDEPSALVRLRAGVFMPGNAYHSDVDSYMHRAIVDVIWRF